MQYKKELKGKYEADLRQIWEFLLSRKISKDFRSNYVIKKYLLKISLTFLGKTFFYYLQTFMKGLQKFHKNLSSTLKFLIFASKFPQILS